MAKKTTKPAPKKPVTMAERVKRIELDVNRHGVGLDARVRHLHDLVAVIAAQLGRMEPELDKIESKLSLILSGQSFMQELEQAQPTKEQGLEPGDYCSGTPEELKEVADKLTAMGWRWYDSDRCKHKFIVREHRNADCARMINTYTHRRPHDKNIPRPEFLSRAAVTAKELGLEPVELPKVWKPKVGELVVMIENEEHYLQAGELCEVDELGTSAEGVFVNSCTPSYGDGAWSTSIGKLRPATPEEIAKYHADKEAEAAKPIVPFTTRVKTTGGEWLVIHGPSPSGNYTLQRDVDGYCDTLVAERHEFTVIL